MIGISKNCVNEVTIIGTISENFEFDHEAYGKKEKKKRYVKPSQKLIESAKKYGINIVG